MPVLVMLGVGSVKLLERVNFIKSFTTNSSPVTKEKYGRLPEIKLYLPLQAISMSGRHLEFI